MKEQRDRLPAGQNAGDLSGRERFVNSGAAVRPLELSRRILSSRASDHGEMCETPAPAARQVQ
jgi:hypothetical protein